MGTQLTTQPQIFDNLTITDNLSVVNTVQIGIDNFLFISVSGTPFTIGIVPKPSFSSLQGLGVNTYGQLGIV